VTYGLGSEARDLPGFVVLQSGPRGPRGGAPLWASGFLPTAHQGVPLRNQGDPILNLSRPPGTAEDRQRQVIDAVRDLNEARLADTGDPEIATRIAAYEMAYRMQTSAPELIDLRSETKETLDLYGAEPGKPSFANNCLLARRLAERDVRFIQLYHTDWDHHGDTVNNLTTGLDKVCREVDRPTAALITDLKRRGLLDDTLVIWGGEFGRTPMGEKRDTVGRNHHIDAYTMFLAGGGVQRGVSLGETDEFGFGPAADKVHVHDLQATVLHLLGLEHTKLTFRFQGRDFRLTDVEGAVVRKLLA
jgi:arylsulfatase A-like enzyme